MLHVEAMKSELDVFAATPIQTSVERGQWISFKPVSAVDSNNTLEFFSPSSSDECIDLALTMFQLKVKIVNQDGSPLAADAKVGPVNNFMHSMFSQVDVFLNQKLVSPAANTYSYRAYLETLLNYDHSAKDTHLASSLWHKDTADKFNSLKDNVGFKTRQKRTEKSTEIEMYGPLFCDLFNINKYLVSGVDLRIKMARNPARFALMAELDTFRVVITDATLHIRKVRIAPKILLAHESALARGTAKYPLTRTETKVLTIGSGISSTSLDNVYLGTLPKRIVIGLVTNTAYSGDVTKNPFEFGHHGLNHLSLYVDHEQVPNKPLTPDFTKGMFTMAYYTLFSGTGIHFKDAGNAIPLHEYDKGYTLYAFDLTPDLSASSSGHWNPLRTGQLRIELGFAKPTIETLNCVVYAEFQGLLQIDHQRNILIDT